MTPERYEQRLLELTNDILLAVARGELGGDEPVVHAAAAAVDRLRRAREERALTALRATASASDGAGGNGSGRPSAGGISGADGSAPERVGVSSGKRGPRTVPAAEHVLAVATMMRAEQVPFAAACARQGEDSGVSAQAVRNACCRWLDLAAADWQPLAVNGADEAAVRVARRFVERNAWGRDRAASAFRVPVERLRILPGELGG